jgi:hypothetical protein
MTINQFIFLLDFYEFDQMIDFVLFIFGLDS